MGYIKNDNSIAITIDSSLIDPQTMQVVPTKTVCWIDMNNFDVKHMNIVATCYPLCAQTYCAGHKNIM